jgi:membrane protease YdiL (CAAX protease family)
MSPKPWPTGESPASLSWSLRTIPSFHRELPASEITGKGDGGRGPGLRGVGPLGIAAILVVLAGNFLFAPLSALLVLAWVQASETPWAAIGFVRPKSWLRTIAIGLVFGALFKLVMKAVVMPLLGAPAVNATYHYVAGNAAALPYMLYALIIGAGFGEETVYRGFLFERLGKLLGTSTMAKIAIVVLTTTLFAAAHYPEQGVPGLEQAVFTGLVFGGIYAVTGQLFMLMVAHAAFDLVALALIYWNLESRIAHLFFS